MVSRLQRSERAARNKGEDSMNSFRVVKALGALTATAAVVIAAAPASAHWAGSGTARAGRSNLVTAHPSGTIQTHRAAGTLSRGKDSSAALAGYCVLATGASGDANWITGAAGPPPANTYNMDSLDLTAVGVKTDADGKTLDFAIQVNNLSDGIGGAPSPQLYGEGSIWEIDLATGVSKRSTGKPFFIQVAYGAAAPVDSTTSFNSLPTWFNYGNFSLVGAGPFNGVLIEFTQLGMAAGDFDLKDNLITVKVPASAFGLGTGDTLTVGSNQDGSSMHYGESFVYLGNPQTTTANQTVPSGLASGFSSQADYGMGAAGAGTYNVGDAC
jgi:hypothetical protein